MTHNTLNQNLEIFSNRCELFVFETYQKKLFEGLLRRDVKLANLYRNGLEILTHDIDFKIQISAYVLREFMVAWERSENANNEYQLKNETRNLENKWKTFFSTINHNDSENLIENKLQQIQSSQLVAFLKDCSEFFARFNKYRPNLQEKAEKIFLTSHPMTLHSKIQDWNNLKNTFNSVLHRDININEVQFREHLNNLEYFIKTVFSPAIYEIYDELDQYIQTNEQQKIISEIDEKILKKGSCLAE